PVAPMVADTLDDDVEDELDLDDDLFGESSDDELLFSDDIDQNDADNNEPDVFADLDDGDLDFNLESETEEDPFAAIGEDGVLDESVTSPGISTNGISVDADEKALGLEEMERALNDVVIEDESEGNDFDLSDSAVNQAELDDLFSSALGENNTGDSFDQAMLDELLSESATDDGELNFDNLLDESSDEFDLDSEDSQSLESLNIASDSDIDDLFAQVEAQANLDQLEQSSQSTQEQAALDKLEDDNSALFDELFEPSVETEKSTLEQPQQLDELLDAGEDDFDLSSDDDTELLSEWLDDSDEESLTQLTEDSTAMLDELLDGNEDFDDGSPKSVPPLDKWGEESELDADDDLDDFDLDSISMLDELLDEEELEEKQATTTYDADSTDLLDDLFAEDTSEDDSEFGDEATDLFEELLEIEKSSASADAFELSDGQESELTADSLDLDSLLLDESEEQEQHQAEESLLEPSAQEEPQVEEPKAEENRAFSSEDFVDDMLSVAPEADPLLGEFNFDQLADEPKETDIDQLLEQAQQSLPEPEPEPEP
ncbi:MAG TPA: AAA family ATPase, partial [Vibrio sp.]|nr:AAA family ATPase [Vibrio sp.]